MSEVSTTQFYSDIPELNKSLSSILKNKDSFLEVPDDWHVVLTDIKDSTKAVSEGKHEVVNLVATGSIIAVLNIAHSNGISIPFFFGGDGATLIIPEAIFEESISALKEHQQNTSENFNLFLRVGAMSVSEVKKNDYKLSIAKARINKHFSIPIMLGNGLHYVEKTIKGKQEDLSENKSTQKVLNLEGMECRWDRIKPPEDAHQIICLLVKAEDVDKQSGVYSQILEKIETIYGSHKKRNPISTSGLKLNATLNRISSEMKVKEGGRSIKFLMKRAFATAVGKYYLTQKEEGKNYLKSIADLTDTLVLDGRINTVISGIRKQHDELEAFLKSLEDQKLITYGIHRTGESIMSCYVRDRKDQHIHFVDGADGGYTRAAGVLKSKK